MQTQEREMAFDQMVDRTTAALQPFVTGDAGPFQDLWSHRPDVTIFGGWGACEQGSAAMGARLDWAAARYVEGAVTCAMISQGVSGT
jgi:hypothetical protein